MNAVSAEERMDQRSDDDLIGCALGGDKSAFGELVTRYERVVFSFCLRYLADPEDAREAFQETFLRVYVHLNRFTFGRRVLPWVLTIARNQCLDRLRKKRRRPEESLEGWIDDHGTEPQAAGTARAAASPGEAEPRRLAGQHETEERIRAAIRNLPRPQREVVILRHHSGLSFGEIAETVGCSVGTAKSRFHYGFRSLAERIRSLAPEEEV